MDLQEVKTCLRALLSSTAFSYNLNNLLSDFRNMTGVDLPLFGCLHPVEFLRTLDDTVQLLGNPFDPEIALIESKKSAHIISLVDRQKTNTLKHKYPHFMTKHRRLILPNKDQIINDSRQNKFKGSTLFSFKNDKETKTSESSLRRENTFGKEKETKTSQSYPRSENALNVPKEANLPLARANLLNLPPGKNDAASAKARNPAQRKKVQVHESQEVEKTDSCFFEDVSDNESCISIGGSRSSLGHPVSLPCDSVNEGIKNKLMRLIKGYPEGLWCCELPELFLKEFQFVLDYREFGYTSLIQMLSELPDVFRCIRPGNEDWILFDASVPPSGEEKKMMVLQSTANTNREVRMNLKKLLLNHLKNSSDSGIELNRIPDLYRKTFGRPLDVQSLGFKDVASLMESWEESSLQMLKINGNIFVVPTLKIRNPSPSRWEAVPPITAENDLFLEIFPKDVVGPEEKLSELDLYRHVAVGHVVEVCVAEVWSPAKFYLQLNKFKNRLNRFMDDLQRFYNVHLNKYKMPNSTIRPNQVCVGLYSSEPEFPDEWHRAQIVKVINEKTVLINFVDFGTVTRVKKTHLRFLHRSFQYFPVQAFLAELSGVAPPNDQEIWPMSTNRKFLEYLRLPYFKAEIIDIDFKKPAMSVVLFDPFQKPAADLNKKLIQEKLAWEKEPVTDAPFLLPESDEEDSKPAENEKKALTDNSSSVQESFNKNLPNEFSDITDLSRSTLFHFQMKSLKLENSQEKESLKKAGDNLNVTFEFEDVPDLEKNNEEKRPEDAKENAQNDVSETKEIFSKLIPPHSRNVQSFNPGPPPPEPPPLSKPKSFPPGLERGSAIPPFPQTLFLVSPDNLKKRINILAMELLGKNASIQQVGVNDPALALKIATEMAEAYISSEIAGLIPHGLNPILGTSVLVASTPTPTPPMETAACEPRPPELVESGTNPDVDLSDIMAKQDKSQIPSGKPKAEVKVKKVQINGKDVHLVVLDSRFYFCADEIVRTFTLISSREIADRVLIIKRVNIHYRVLSKKTDEEALRVIKSSDLPVVKKKSKKLKVYLVPLEKVVPFLQGLGCQTESFENEFFELEDTKREEELNLSTRNP